MKSTWKHYILRATLVQTENFTVVNFFVLVNRCKTCQLARAPEFSVLNFPSISIVSSTFIDVLRNFSWDSHVCSKNTISYFFIRDEPCHFRPRIRIRKTYYYHLAKHIPMSFFSRWIMAMKIPKSGYNRFMKEGAQHFKGTDEAVQRNIDACIELASQIRSAYGPNG